MRAGAGLARPRTGCHHHAAIASGSRGEVICSPCEYAHVECACGRKCIRPCRQRRQAGACDTGIVQRNSVTHDDAATVSDAVAYYRTFDAHVAHDVDALSGEDVRLVVADIAPLGLAVAARLGVPSIFVGNFTWDWIYEGYAAFATEAPHVVPTIAAAYATMLVGITAATLAAVIRLGGAEQTLAIK